MTLIYAFSSWASPQKAGDMDDTNGATLLHEATLVVEKLDDITNSFIDNMLKHLHATRRQANWLVVCAVCRTALFLLNGKPLCFLTLTYLLLRST